MNDNIFENLKESLEEAVAHKKGQPNRCRVTVREIPVPEYDAQKIASIRQKLNLSQKGLAAALGVSGRTVEAWETGKNTPSGAARNLLYLIEKDNSLVNNFIIR